MILIPIHLAALAILMYLYARHEADISPPKIALVFVLPIWLLNIASNFIGFYSVPLYFLVVLVCLKLWFYVGWGKAAAIGGTFVAYLIVFSLIFQNLTKTPVTAEKPKTEYIVGKGSYKPFKGISILIGKDYQDKLSCQISANRYLVYELNPEVRADPDWFIFCESRDSYWLYLGQDKINHIAIQGRESVVLDLVSDPDLLTKAPAGLTQRIKETETTKVEQAQQTDS